MTLGCGSWGGNVTSDNVSPLHLLDIKRVAFETRPVKSTRPAVAASTATTAAPSPAPPARQPQPVVGQQGKINREEIAAIVDTFLANRRPEDIPAPPVQRTPQPPRVEAEAGSMYAGPSQGASQGNGESTSARPATPTAAASANGNKTVDFVSEDDVRRAIQKGEKIYINAKTIITPAARDIGEPAEVFAKG